MIKKDDRLVDRGIGAISLSAGLAIAPAVPASASSVPRFDHVVIVVMENKNEDAIIGRPMKLPT